MDYKNEPYATLRNHFLYKVSVGNMIFKVFPRLRLRNPEEEVRSRDAFIYLDRGMRAVGWIPPEHKYGKQLYLLWTIFLTTLCIVLLSVSLLVSYFKDLRGFTAGQFLTSLQVGLNCFGSSIKASYTFAGVARFQRVKMILDRLDKRCNSVHQRKQLHLTVARCNRFYMCYQIMYSFYAASTFLAGTFSGRLPWKLYNPFIDWQASNQHFWLACSVEYFWMCGAVLQDQMADYYPINYFLVIRTHITMLKDRLQNLRTDPALTEDENYTELINCIEDHRLILEYCNTLRPVISATIFVQFLLCGVVIGLSIINIMFFSNFWMGLGTGVFIVDLLLQTFPFCYICNMIISDCEELTYCLFHSNWISANHRYKTTFRYFLHNLQQPIVLSAGGIFIISLGTNITVAKLAFTVVTFVKQLNIADRFIQ